METLLIFYSVSSERCQPNGEAPQLPKEGEMWPQRRPRVGTRLLTLMLNRHNAPDERTRKYHIYGAAECLRG